MPAWRPDHGRDFAAGLHLILRDYFGVDGKPPVYSDAHFERRFHVPRILFLRIYNDVKEEPYFQQRVTPTGMLQADPLQKLVAAFRVLCYGDGWD